MGLFDTVHLKSDLVCPTCGRQERSCQTHAFDDSMANYRIGSIVQGGVLTGIIEETFWCSDCHKAGNDATSPVYLVVWHSILVAVEQELALAEARLSAVDRLNLIGWLDEAQKQEDRWKRKFYGLLRDVERWHEHLEDQKNPEPVPEDGDPEKTRRLAVMKRFWSLPEEILTAPDPLAVIIENNKPGADDKDPSWF